MDEREGAASALEALHGAGLLAVIAALVAAGGFDVEAFLGDGVGTDASAAERDRARSVPTAAVADPAGAQYRLPSTTVGTPDPDQQAAFLEAVRLSGTGGWSSRLEILGHGVRACRLLASGLQPTDVAQRLVAQGERRPQAEAVVAVAPNTLCAA